MSILDKTNNSTRRAKLLTLTRDEGYASKMESLEAYIMDSVVPGICCNPHNLECDYSTGVEPDCGEGWCEMMTERQLINRAIAFEQERMRLNIREWLAMTVMSLNDIKPEVQSELLDIRIRLAEDITHNKMQIVSLHQRRSSQE